MKNPMRSKMLPAVLFLAAAAATAAAPKKTADPDSLLAVGHRCLQERKPDEAQAAFEAVLDIRKSDRTAMAGMASADQMRFRWGNAAEWYDRILDKTPDDLDGHYGLAVCKRELGRHVVLLQRYLEWRSAEKHFRAIMQADSTFRDVLYQIALLEMDRGHYADAILLAHRQLAVHPKSVSGRAGIFRVYDIALNHWLTDGQLADSAETWFKSRTTPHDRYYLGELYRRTGRLQPADSVFISLLARPDSLPLQPVLLSRVRLFVERDEPQRANDLYWEAVRSVSSDLEAEFLKQEMMPIVNAKEYQVLKGPVPFTVLPELLRAFWFRRNPAPSSPYNLRLVEHFRRMVHAEKRYRFDGFKTSVDQIHQFLSFPDWHQENEKFNDMGLIYIRFGEPDDQATVQGDRVETNMSWLYKSRGESPQMVFHFMSNSPGIWFLVRDLPDSNMIANLVDWDIRYHEASSGSELNRYSMQNRISDESAKTVDEAFQADRQTWSARMKILSVIPGLYRFRVGPSRDYFDWAYGIPIPEMMRQIGAHDTVRIETGIEIFDSRLKSVWKESHRLTLKDTSDARLRDGILVDHFEFELPLRRHLLAFHARVDGTDILNGWKYAIPADDSARGDLALGTLLPAYTIEPKGELKGRDRSSLRISPNPTGRARISEPLYLYYEIYNLGLDSKGSADYNIQLSLRRTSEGKSVLQRIGGLFGGGGSHRISIENRRTGKNRNAQDYIGMDVRNAPPGHYELSLKVTDRVTGLQTGSAVPIVLN
jgi:tetratricopeptide (TPR) repeat protein